MVILVRMIREAGNTNTTQPMLRKSTIDITRELAVNTQNDSS
jgi:hypothetical protein